MNLDQFVRESGLLIHGSPQAALEKLIAADGGTLALDHQGRVLAPGKTVFATESTALAVFVATVWSRDGLSGWESYVEPDGQVWHRFFAAPCVLRQALDATGSLYLVQRQDFVPFGHLPDQYVLRPGFSETRTVLEIPVAVWDMDTRIFEDAHMPREPRGPMPSRGEGPMLDVAKLRTPGNVRDLRARLPLPDQFRNWYLYLDHEMKGI